MKRDKAWFLKEKSESLNLEKDRSFIGEWDKKIVPLLGVINNEEMMFSTSSCSGRICLMGYKKVESQKKYDAEFVFNTHEIISFEEFFKKTKDRIKEYDAVWFQQEPVIIHIRFFQLDKECGDVMHIFRTVCGFKKTGVFEITPGKVMMEVLSVEVMKTIIGKNGRLLVSDECLGSMLEEANLRILRGHSKIEKARGLLTQYFIRSKVEFFRELWFGPPGTIKHLSLAETKKKKRMKKSKRVSPIFSTSAAGGSSGRTEIRSRLISFWKQRHQQRGSLPTGGMMGPTVSGVINKLLDAVKSPVWSECANNEVLRLLLLAFYSPSSSRSWSTESSINEDEETEEQCELFQLYKPLEMDQLCLIEILMVHLALMHSVDVEVRKFGSTALEKFVAEDKGRRIFPADKDDIFLQFIV